MISYILVIIITVLMTLLVVFLVKKKMPFPIRLNGSWRKKGFFSDDWMDWMQDNFSDAKGNCTLYDYLIGRKIRQERYAKRHVVSYHTVQDDVMYDTDNADLIMVKYTKFSGTEPCAKHYFANKKHDAFFTITVRMGKPDDFSKMTIKELKNLLRDKPTLYQKFIPGAEKNEGLAEYVKRYEEAEAKRKLEEEQKRVEDETREKEKENERLRKKEEKEREKEELRKQREDEKNQVKIEKDPRKNERKQNRNAGTFWGKFSDKKNAGDENISSEKADPSERKNEFCPGSDEKNIYETIQNLTMGNKRTVSVKGKDNFKESSYESKNSSVVSDVSAQASGKNHDKEQISAAELSNEIESSEIRQPQEMPGDEPDCADATKSNKNSDFSTKENTGNEKMRNTSGTSEQEDFGPVSSHSGSKTKNPDEQKPVIPPNMDSEMMDDFGNDFGDFRGMLGDSPATEDSSKKNQPNDQKSKSNNGQKNVSKNGQKKNRKKIKASEFNASQQDDFTEPDEPDAPSDPAASSEYEDAVNSLDENAKLMPNQPH